MYVSLIVVVSQLPIWGIQPGEPFKIRKHLKKQGTRRLIEWDVHRIASEPETQLERELRESIAVAQTAKAAPHSGVNGESNPQSPQRELICQCHARSRHRSNVN